MSGPFASSGEIMADAAKLFLATEGKQVLGDQAVELVVRDDGGTNPDTAKRPVQELVTRDRVQYLAGFQWTPNANAVGPLLNQAKTPCVLFNAAGVRDHAAVALVRAHGLHPMAAHLPLGDWAAKTKGYKPRLCAGGGFRARSGCGGRVHQGLHGRRAARSSPA